MTNTTPKKAYEKFRKWFFDNKIKMKVRIMREIYKEKLWDNNIIDIIKSDQKLKGTL